MLARDVFNQATAAASIAMASGFEETSFAFQEIALEVYRRMDSLERQSLVFGEVSVPPNKPSCGDQKQFSGNEVRLTYY